MKVLDQLSVLTSLAALVLPHAVNAVTVSPVVSCPPVPISSPAAGMFCNRTGDVNSGRRKSIRTFKSKSSPPGDDCLTECLKDTTCLSYSYDSAASKTECRLMLRSVLDQVFTAGATGITWWDRGCWTVPTTCSQPTATPTTTTATTPIKCNRDLVLRALYGKGDAASSFCSTYTNKAATSGQAYPTYLTSWSTEPTRISSACTCLSISPLVTSTSTTSTTTSEEPVETIDPTNTDWLSTYTWTEATLPEFTSFPVFEDTPVSQPPFPSTTQTDAVPTFTPLEQNCVFDPLNLDTKYEITMNAPDESRTFIDFIVEDILESSLKLMKADFETEEEANAWTAPLFHFEQPTGAPSGFYDLVIETPGLDKKWVAYDTTNGYIHLSTHSTKGQTADSWAYITTMFTIDCDGKVVLADQQNTYLWRAFVGGSGDGNLYVETTGEETMVLRAQKHYPETAEPQRRSLNRRGKGNQGGNPRCPSLPNSNAVVRGGARGTYDINNCGEGNTAGTWDSGYWAVKQQCKDLHKCYDDCGKTWEECNIAFRDGGYDYPRCGGLNWKTGAQQACKKTITNVYNFLQDNGGRNNFNRANNERCTCVCDNNGSICNGQCADSNFFTSKQNCGACNRACQDPYVCNSSRNCDCNWGALGRNSPDNCGVCGRRCATEKGIICSNGECVCPKDTQNDSNNCGACGNICPSGTHCSAGQCKCNQDQCGNTCLSFKFNPNNCGSCGNVCASGYCRNGACFTPPANQPVCVPKEVVVNGGFDGGNWSPWTGPHSTGIASGSIQYDPRSPPDSPYSLQLVLPTTEVRYYQFAHMYQVAEICVGQKYAVRYSARVERPNQYRGGCDVAVLVPGQYRFEERAINIDQQEYTNVYFEFTADQGVVAQQTSWYDIVAPDGATGTVNLDFKFSCWGGGSGGGLVRFDSISILPI